ncbi:TetR/AcrR family transcriptional regulator [Mucilaginibacter paludis]|uniref:HTH tetR-type domain-containing protein n=1 Tax=Mucilaginibacter paludis DSM 18603 TaxID=714943 RepID=H1Y365_9SPHI|nr:TetR/AcrR family transcriptional regulator [Mucilaginibacter paludis]EHQ28883.1 hypothetical protein Mucpa_4798 [Mucilaginibacter paludis DSM 18603]
MATQIPQPMLNTAKQQIVDHTIALICKNGIDQISIRQIAMAAKVSPANIIHTFCCLDSLVTQCTKHCFDALEVFIACSKHRLHKQAGNIETFWKILVEFNCDHASKASIICMYLKDPALFPAIEIKHSLIQSLANEFDRIEHDLRTCNNQIRFIAFIHLFRMACRMAKQLNLSYGLCDHDRALNYYHNAVEWELNRLLKLPIS